mgnify:CR=1 FL=1
MRFAAPLLAFLFLLSCQEDLATDNYIELETHQEVLRSREKLSRTVDSLQQIVNQNTAADFQADSTSPYEIAPPAEDSILDNLQKTMNVKVDLPLLFTEAMVHPELMQQFNDLAKSTGGKLTMLAKSDEIEVAIREIIEKHGSPNLDLMIIMDNTGSMQNDILDVKEGLNEIIDGIKKYPGTRLAFASYGDKNNDPDTWYSFQEFDEDYESLRAHLAEVPITGGGDYEESVYDGVYQALEEGFFKARRERMVILIGDAPGHDKKSKTDKQLSDIIRLARSRKLKMNFYPVIIHPGQRSLTGPSKSSKGDMFPLVESVYPNPSRGAFNIRFYQSQKHVVEIFDQNAQLVQRLNFEELELRIKLDKPSPGLYTIRVQNSAGNFDLKKIIIK